MGSFRLTVLVALLVALLPSQASAQAQNRAKLANKYSKKWQKLDDTCKVKINDYCAHLAIVQADTECAEAGKIYSKGSTTWTWINFALVVASAASTAVGASGTIPSAKIWSTLGGTTALGAVSTTANANSTTDMNGLAAVNAAQQNFNTFVIGNYGNPTLIYDAAYGFGSACVTAGPGSATTKPVALTILTTKLADGSTTASYSQFLGAAGGTPPYTWVQTAGTLPVGLKLNPSTGEIAGQPTATTPAATPATVTFKVTDSTGQTATVSNLSLSVPN